MGRVNNEKLGGFWVLGKIWIVSWLPLPTLVYSPHKPLISFYCPSTLNPYLLGKVRRLYGTATRWTPFLTKRWFFLFLEGGDRFLHLDGVAGADADVAALLHQEVGDGASDAACAPHDDALFTLQSKIHAVFLHSPIKNSPYLGIPQMTDRQKAFPNYRKSHVDRRGFFRSTSYLIRS